MRPVVSNDRGLRRLARSTTTTALLIAVAGCGSSSDHAAKQARIAGALNKLEREVVAGNRELRRKFRGKDLLGEITLVYARPPQGVSKAEWETAMKHDKRLQRLEGEEGAAPPRP